MPASVPDPHEREWREDPYGCAATVIRAAVSKALDHQGAMSDDEAKHLTDIHEEVST